jgi:hypothetical protein
MNEIIGQILGIAATVITFISYQVNTKSRLLIIQTTATLCTCLSFLFLGASTGFALNIVCIVRNVAFFFQKEKSAIHTVTALLLAVAMIVLGVLSWQGPVSLLIIIALFANTLFMATGNPQLLRKSVIVTSGLILIYNAIVFSIGGMTNEGISIISSVIGIMRFKKDGHRA